MGADGERVTRIHLGHLVNRDVIGQLVHSGPTQLLGPGNAEEAKLAHGLDVVPRKRRSPIELRGDGCDMITGKLPDHFADLMVVLVEVE